jgi:rhodanese-related sulfurtransferase
MMRKWFLWVTLLLLTTGLFVPAFSAEAPRMSQEELKALLGHPDLVIIDVRYGKDWANSDAKIKGAVREDPDGLKSWANKYSPDKTIVLY